MAEMVYRWANGGHRVPAQVAGEELVRIRAEHGKMFKPAHVVEASRDSDAPLHPAFEWDDAVAASEHREYQARKLIGAIVVVNQSEPAQAPIRAFVSVQDDEGDHQFTTIAHAMAQPSLREQVLRQAERDMQAFERKYQRFLDLSRVVSAFRVAKTRAQDVPELRAG